MIARHFRPRTGDVFVGCTGCLRIDEVGDNHVHVYNGGRFTWSMAWHRVAVERAMKSPLWFYTREGGAGLL